jgi:hypothetical protein
MSEDRDIDRNESDPTDKPNKNAAYFIGGGAAALLVLLMVFQTSC